VGGIICCSASAERLCPRGASARVSDHVSLSWRVLHGTDFPATCHKFYSVMLRETWTTPRIHGGHDTKVYWNPNVCN
jgi:hypothetical protein